MDIPATKVAAREHIAQIRKGKGLDGPESNTSDLEAALIILSEQLYQQATHFLLELIQNADDNSYEALGPTLNLSYSRRTLRLDCNEIGFDKKNVEAICKIGRSTKAELGNRTRYIGEKGIGFKSVFKVAEVAWITSGHYSFKFDKKETLGMIAPIWEEFPEPRLPGHTSILLRLSDNYDPGELIAEIKSLDPRLLIFLRTLRQVNLMSFDGGRIWRSTLRRHDIPYGKDGENIVELWHNAEFSSLKITNFLVFGLPSDPKRLGCTQSEILLAFPLTQGNEPSIKSQNVYAFLPIRDYGFKFLLQADFLLIASREDIDSSSAWNRKLLDSIPEAFLKAINEFQNGKLRYTWMRYLPSRPSLTDFFQNLESAILRLLSNAPVVENFAGNLAAPSKLKSVPVDFADDNGAPLICSSRTKSTYISQNYSFEDVSELMRLGVESLSAEGFLADLSTLALENPHGFQQMPNAWHGRLSKALSRIICDDEKVKATVSELEIVPLYDGRWVSSNQKNICFSNPLGGLTVPKGIEVFEIHPDAARNHFRRSLFIHLGAKTFSKDLVCDTIVQMHEHPQFNPRNQSNEDMIAHMMFLYRANWKNLGNHDLWLVTEFGSARRGSDIYLDSEELHSATTLLKEHRKEYPFLHEDYFQAFSCTDLDWTAWLVKNLRLAKYPRLVVPSTDPESILSKDFQLLLSTCSSQQILLLLRDNWDYYSTWIGPDNSLTMEASRTKLTEKLSSIQVTCCGGREAPLNQTIIPMGDMVHESIIEMFLLDIPEPEDTRWKCLRHLGVVVESGAGPFIQCLQRLKVSGASLKQVSELYTQIQRHAVRHGETIRNAFRTEKLVYIPVAMTGGTENWTDLSICVWDGPKILRNTPCLRDYYPEHQHFFYNTLGISNATWKTVMEEAQYIQAFDSLEYISQIFITLSNYLKKEDHAKTVTPMDGKIFQTLIQASIFPIEAKDSNTTFDHLSTAQQSEIWFIADRLHLRQSFEGLVPLLALNVESVEKIYPLIKKLDLEHRLLSKVARGIPATKGLTKYHSKYTLSLRSKSRAIARILPDSLINREAVTAQLCNVEVYSAEMISIEWKLSVGSKTSGSLSMMSGRSESGRVNMTRVGNVLKIILRENDVDLARPPLELQEEMTKFCGITNPLHAAILHWILIEEDLRKIEDGLQRRGIPKLPNELPESENMPRNVSEGEDWPFPTLGATPLDNDPKTSGQRRYRGREKYHCTKQESVDPMQSFINKFNLASSFKDKITRPWKDAEAQNMLSHICRLENPPPYLLLPQRNDRWTQWIRKAGGYPDDYIVTIFNDRLTSHGKRDLSRTTRSAQTFPATVKVVGNGQIRIAVSALASSMTNEEILFAGELYVSKLLEKHMGGAYSPDFHWTSRLRGRAGLLPYENIDETHSSFTIDDRSGRFTELISRSGYKDAALWSRYPIYHIEVNTSEAGLDSAFCLDPYQVHKAWNLNVGMKLNSIPEEVFVLIRIYNVRTDPELALWVDPWQMHIDGLLSLKADSQYEATLLGLPPSAGFAEPVALGLPSNHGTKKGLEKFLHRRSKSTQSQNNPMYSYKQLGFGEIRLLELFPGTGEMPINGLVRHVPLESAGQYSALSYVWGPALKTFDLQTSDGKIPLTASLHSALKRLRDKDVSMICWVDAVCIDQTDDHEKIIQIRLLQSIFQKAEKVFAWIGEEKDNSNRVVEFLLQIRTLTVNPDEWPRDLPPISSSWFKNTLTLDEVIWDEVSLFFQRDWFHRVWVVQELVLASKVRIVCGRWDVNWDDIFSALETCLKSIGTMRLPNLSLRKFVTHAKPAHALGLTRRLFKDPRLSIRFNLLSLLDMFAHTEATKERDKLFALLGLASDAGDEIFNPNYTSSLESVVRRYANEFSQRGNAMDLLYRAGTSKSYRFCSWIPRWTGGEPCRTISTWHGAKGSFSAGANSCTESQPLLLEQNKLQVFGAAIDIIDFLCPTTTNERDIIYVVNDIHATIDKLEGYPTGESHKELKFQVPIGNTTTPCFDDIGTLEILRTETRNEDHTFRWTEEFSAINSVQEMVDFVKQPRNTRERGWKYWRTAAAFAKRLSNGRFCVTRRGYVGFVPDDAKLGDVVCVIHGGAVPFVLRMISGSDSVFSLIGECYIHGIMYGEGLSLDGIQKRSFVLV